MYMQGVLSAVFDPTSLTLRVKPSGAASGAPRPSLDAEIIFFLCYDPATQSLRTVTA